MRISRVFECDCNACDAMQIGDALYHKMQERLA